MICICPHCGSRFNPNLSGWTCPKCRTDFSNNKEALCPKKDETAENVEKTTSNPIQEKPIFDSTEKLISFIADAILLIGIISAIVATTAFFDEDYFEHRNFWADRFYIVAGILVCSIFFNATLKILGSIVRHLHEQNSSIKNPGDSEKEHLQ